MKEAQVLAAAFALALIGCAVTSTDAEVVDESAGKADSTEEFPETEPEGPTCVVGTTVCVGGPFEEPTFVSGCSRQDEMYWLDRVHKRTTDACLDLGGSSYRHYVITAGGACGTDTEPRLVGGPSRLPTYDACPTAVYVGETAQEPIECVAAPVTQACNLVCGGQVIDGPGCPDYFGVCACPPWLQEEHPADSADPTEPGDDAHEAPMAADDPTE